MKYRYTYRRGSVSIRTRYYSTEVAARSAMARRVGWFERGYTLGFSYKHGMMTLKIESEGGK